MVNALCIDVDDLCYTYLEIGLPLTRIEYNLEKELNAVLNDLSDYNTKATFYISGSTLKYSAKLILECSDAGHEIASHGITHVYPHKLGKDRFLKEIIESKKRLQDLTGKQIRIFKAPIWGITKRSIWVCDALLTAGFKIDNSVLPLNKKAFQVKPAENRPFYYKDSLCLIPPTSFSCLKQTIPFAGGLFNAYYPYTIQKRIINNINKKSIPVNYCFHPFEYEPNGQNRKIIKYRNWLVSTVSLHNGIYKKHLKKLMNDFTWAPLSFAYKKYVK